MSSSTAQQPAPRFERGQRVRIIANEGGLYHAQIGVVGVIERKRQYRRWGYHTYDVSYQDKQGRDKLVTSVREDDLEAVSDVADWLDDEPEPEPTTEPMPEPTPEPSEVTVQPPAPFNVGDLVTVRPPVEGQEEDDYPAFTAYPVVGEIVSGPLVYAAGRCYDVRFPRIVNGVSSECWPPVAIREAHLTPEPWHPGWLAHEAAMEQVKARTKASAHRPTKTPAKASTKAPTKPPYKPPTFSVGEHITVDPRSALAYESFTRKGAVGVITEIGKPVRGIRRYTVRFEVPHLAGTRESRIREEHLVKAEPPAPRQYATARHAYEYRAEKKLRLGERLWCDAAGCFQEACAICQLHPSPTIWTSPEMPYSTAALAALDADDPYEFAVALVREKLEHGILRDAILSWQADRQWIYTVGGGTCYDVARGGFYVTMIRGLKCSARYALKTLVAEAERRMAGAPRQVGLWGSEAIAR